MIFSPRGINLFIFIKLPSAWWSGVRVTQLNNTLCEVKVRLNWFNKNPFRSMFWAVQGMAAELTTGVLIMLAAKKQKCKVSMLVLNNKASFMKKAKGKITFTCTDVALVENQFKKLLKSESGARFWMESEGIDQQGNVVSRFRFEWSLKARSKA